ncbi:MAG: hypothetical protein QOC99_3678 [Acidobacteriota bacterium]|nr:hypothetical protein [Acidobacteriota bacterium]
MSARLKLLSLIVLCSVLALPAVLIAVLLALHWLLVRGVTSGSSGIGAVAGGFTLTELGGGLLLFIAGLGLLLFAALRGRRLK